MLSLDTEKPELSEIGKTLRAARLIAKKNQLEMSKSCGMKLADYSAIECGRKVVSLDESARLSKIAKVVVAKAGGE